MADLHSLARGLAEAFLAGEWQPSALADRGAEALGHRYRWLGRLGKHVVRAFDAPPDAELLARFLAADRGLKGENRREPLLLRKVVFSEPRMAPAPGAPERWEPPSLPTEQDLASWLGAPLADLHWLADVSGRLARGAAGPLQHYSLRWTKKRSGAHRLLEAPKSRLKAIQRRVLHGILDRVPGHDASHGFRRGRGVLGYVAPHVAQHAVLHLDLREFFASVSRARVRAIFHTLGYPPPVARLLAGLCTTRVPLAEWARAPRPGTADEARARWRAGRFYRAPHLPQGAPTSPALANLSAFRLYLRLAGAAGAVGASYTRYADDLALSGGPDFARRAAALTRLCARVAREEGFVLHDGKARLMARSARQRLTGVVVNVRPNVARADYDRLKAILHNCITRGPESQNREGHADFRAHLTGRVAWVESVNPAKGKKLRARLEAIRWPGSARGGQG